MTESKKNISVQYSTKFFLWLLRRPIGIWLVLLFSITSVIGPLTIIFSNSEQMISLMGVAQFTQILVPYLAPAITCVIAGLLAFLMKKESIILFVIYFLLYFLMVFKVDFKDSNILLAGAVQVVLGIFVITYLMHLKRNGHLK